LSLHHCQTHSAAVCQFAHHTAAAGINPGAAACPDMASTSLFLRAGGHCSVGLPPVIWHNVVSAHAVNGTGTGQIIGV